MKKASREKRKMLKGLTLEDGIRIVHRSLRPMTDEKYRLIEELQEFIDRRTVSFFNNKGKMIRKEVRNRFKD